MVQKAITIIPARFESTRFPGKPLALIKGRPMLQRVCENALAAETISEVWVATDDDRIEAMCKTLDISVFRSRREHKTGTDRILEACEHLQADIVVNVQGDEPLLTPEMIDAAVLPFQEKPDLEAPVVTLIKKLGTVEEYMSPHVVKVVPSLAGYAHYFSRSSIPVSFTGGLIDDITDLLSSGDHNFYKHIGLYAFQVDFLNTLPALKPSPLERSEKLEQLRILDNGYKIFCVEVDGETIGVDIPADIGRVEEYLDHHSLE